MNDISVSQVVLPAKHRKPNGSIFRSAAHHLFSGIKIGSLTIHDDSTVSCFGQTSAAEQPHAEVYVHDQAMYREILTGGSIGAGESYMLRHWSTPDLVAVIRLFSANMSTVEAMDNNNSFLNRVLQRIGHTLKLNNLRGSRRNIAAHYDLGNDFFKLFLDREMMYSAAIFPTEEATLEEAALHKLEATCQKLRLQPTDHLLEIGTGWGGMALYAATHFGCRVTTTTLSREQYEYTLARVTEAGLEDRIEVLLHDYRELTGVYDKLVSIEMIEAVGHRYYRDYFAQCSDLLKPGGLMVLQAITIADQRFLAASSSVDFIQQYIFPGGSLPSVAVISKHIAEDTNMQIIGLHDITDDYARTLASWRERFLQQLHVVREQGFDELFIRMWEFYLGYCEGGFRERIIGTVQLTIAKPGFRFRQ